MAAAWHKGKHDVIADLEIVDTLTHGASGGLGGVDLHAVRDGLVESGWAVAFVQQAWGVAGRRMPPRPVPQDEAWLPVVQALRSGRGRLPLITERSEWQSPAARMRTSTSPCPGGSRSSSAISSGLLFA